MEKLLDKLGAEYKDGVSWWILKRLKTAIDTETIDAESTQWLLSGEITETLRERGWDAIGVTFDPPLISIAKKSPRRFKDYEADTLLDCYIKAGEELL